MSDPKSNYGQPVEEPLADDDVVGRAHDSLADAEAAKREAVTDPPEDRDVAAEPVSGVEPDNRGESAPDVERVPPVEPVGTTADGAEPADTPPVPDTPWYHRPEASDAAAPAAASVYSEAPASADVPSKPAYDTTDDDERYAAYEASAASDTRAYPAEEETVIIAGAATPVEPVSPQPIFVQAPEAPRPRGNRGAAGAIGLLAALCFAVLYLAAWLAFNAINGLVTPATFVETLVGALGTWSFWVPVVVFFIAFWLLGAIINRGRWGAWVIFGLLVGLAAYGGHILGALFQAPFWTLTAREGAELVETELLAPLAIAAFVIGRELTIWFGAWVADRGKRVTELNVEARREYERTLEAGPQLARL